ncbi:MAG: hypothetical protein ABH950_08305, partial [Candidatus Altiarchaeota archaeon]
HTALKHTTYVIIVEAITFRANFGLVMASNTLKTAKLFLCTGSHRLPSVLKGEIDRLEPLAL